MEGRVYWGLKVGAYAPRVNHAILHVCDFESCVNVFSEEELDLSDRKVKSYVG